MGHDPTSADRAWTADRLTRLFLANGLAEFIHRRDGNLFTAVPCPDPTQPWHPDKPDGDCLLFTAGSVLARGYRRISVRGRMRLVHVVAYEIGVGPVPLGMDLAHRCVDRPACASPGHTRPETRRTNGREGGLRAWPDSILSLGPVETCPRCGTQATTTVQIDGRSSRRHCWALICPVHAAQYVRAKRNGDRAWAGKWQRPMPDDVQLLIQEHLARRIAG